MDIVSIATAITAGLVKDLIQKAWRGANKKLATPEREAAVDRCIYSALLGILSGVNTAEADAKKLPKALRNFFDDGDTVQELKALFRGKPLNREELRPIYEEHTGGEGVPGFYFEQDMDRFEAAFIEAAIEEPELVEIVQARELRVQSGLQKELLAEMRQMTGYLQKIERNSLAFQKGTLQGIAADSSQTIQYDIPPIEIKVKLETPDTPILVEDVGPEKRAQKKLDAAKRQYLESLAKDCLSLPLALLGDDAASGEDELTLDAVYIDLDTTGTVWLDEQGERIRDQEKHPSLEDQKSRPLKLFEAISETEKCVILGDPGAGKSTFVRNLCAILARANLGECAFPAGIPDGIIPLLIQLRDLAPKVAAIKDIDTLPLKRRQSALRDVVHTQIAENLQYSLETPAYTEALREELRNGNCLLIFDGLDEVPFARRTLIRELVSAVIGKYTPQRLIVTCRIRSYSEQSLTGEFPQFTIAAFDEEKINRFIAAWYQAKKELRKIDGREAGKRIEDLQRGAINLRALAENPMMLTTMAIIHYNKSQLPDERVKLYKLVVDILLRRWRKERLGKDGLKVSPALLALLEDDKKMHEIAARLGYEAQKSAKKNQASADIDREKTVFLLKKEGYLPGLDIGEELLDYADQQSGLLIGRGAAAGKPLSYGFYHRSFQEYLAGCYIVSQWNIATEIIALSEESDYWAPTIQYGFEELYFNEARRGELTLKELAHQLCRSSSPQTVPEARQALWAANVAVLLGATEIENDGKFPNGGKAFLKRLRGALLSLLSGELPFVERAEAGRNLARLGDLEKLHITPIYQFRKERITLDNDEMIGLIKKQSFFDSADNPEGTGCIHIYEQRSITDDKVVSDYASGLIWQQSGSEGYLTYKAAEEYIKQLNDAKFAGFSDWRLPSLEEAMSLMERERQDDRLYINPVFGAKQDWIWTADYQERASRAWYVYFYYGNCYYADIGIDNFVRAVRSGQSSR